MESLKNLIEFMQSISTDSKWNKVTINNITNEQCIILENDLNSLVNNGLEVTFHIERYFDCLWLINNDMMTLNINK